jgi:hypothetical protein
MTEKKSILDKLADAAVSNWEVERGAAALRAARQRERDQAAHAAAVNLTQGNVRIQLGRYVMREELDKEFAPILDRHGKPDKPTR